MKIKQKILNHIIDRYLIHHSKYQDRITIEKEQISITIGNSTTQKTLKLALINSCQSLFYKVVFSLFDSKLFDNITGEALMQISEFHQISHHIQLIRNTGSPSTYLDNKKFKNGRYWACFANKKSQQMIKKSNSWSFTKCLNSLK